MLSDTFRTQWVFAEITPKFELLLSRRDGQSAKARSTLSPSCQPLSLWLSAPISLPQTASEKGLQLQGKLRAVAVSFPIQGQPSCGKV